VTPAAEARAVCSAAITAGVKCISSAAGKRMPAVVMKALPAAKGGASGGEGGGGCGGG
jgi:hypothetical protein